MRRVSDSMLLSLRRGGSPFQWATRKLPVVPVAVYPTPRLARSVSRRRWRNDSSWLTPEMLSSAPGMAIISLLAVRSSATRKRAGYLLSPLSALTRGPHGKRHNEARVSTTLGVSSRPIAATGCRPASDRSEHNTNHPRRPEPIGTTMADRTLLGYSADSCWEPSGVDWGCPPDVGEHDERPPPPLPRYLVFMRRCGRKVVCCTTSLRPASLRFSFALPFLRDRVSKKC